MRNLVKLKNAGLTKLNTPEYLNLMTRTKEWLDAVGFAALGIEADVMVRFEQLLGLLGNLVARSYAHAVTPKMAELEKQRDALGMYIIDNVRNAQNVPIVTAAAAAKSLWLNLKPYEKFYSMPNQQETMMVNGMVEDLKNEKNAPHVATLGLTSYVDELATVNTRYAELTSQRTSQRAAERTEPAKVVRAEMDEQFDDILTIAFVTSVAHPSPEATRFVSLMNAVIAESETAYKQRTVQRTRRKKE